MSNRKKVLVCGATGFIGRNIVEALSKRKEIQVFALYNRRPKYECEFVEWVKGDLTNLNDVDRLVNGIDVIIQAAATTSGSKDIVSRPFIHVTDNAVMNSLLFRTAHERKVKHVIFFSCTVMLQSNMLPQTEKEYDANLELHPKYFGVGHTKLYLEKMCEFYSRLGETKYTVIRHSNIYGPHDKFDLERSHVFGATITKVLQSRDSKVSVWGTGEEERDLLYVDDLVSFVECAIERQEVSYGLYNCGYGSSISIKSLVEKIIKSSGMKLEIEHDLSQPSIKTSLSLNCDKAKSELGWECKTTLEEGIVKVISWWKENIKKA